MTNPWTRAGVACLAALTPATFGGVLFAKLLATGYDVRLLVAVFIGVACASMAVSVTGSRGADAIAGATVSSLVGVALGFFLDAKWNGLAQVTNQMMEQHGLSEAVARQQARTILGGSSLWGLVRDRLDLVGWSTPVLTVLAAAAAPRTRLAVWLVRIRSKIESR